MYAQNNYMHKIDEGTIQIGVFINRSYYIVILFREVDPKPIERLSDTLLGRSNLLLFLLFGLKILFSNGSDQDFQRFNLTLG